ncbi:uracil-DNA glycosylase-like [Diabrotica undecimpunctata]|uniref:uracil-DNA glycosylase-like n=1 Tax=Diabrotica undecimpunctata TaxID=50387 RepID=UPI003B639DA7
MTDFQYFIQEYPVLFKDSNIDESWKPLLASIFTTKINQLNRIASFLSEDPYWFPKSNTLWSFTRFCRPVDVKVIIVGQDPSDADATGLAFSKDIGAGIYPSTETILKEVRSDIGENKLRRFPRNYGNLEYWAKQGVLLLNAALTKGTDRDHLEIGWKDIVIELMKQLQQKNGNIAFMFWGEHAKSLRVHVNGVCKNQIWNQNSAGHPSGYNDINNFLGCKHFSKANAWLVANGMTPIDWCPVPPGNSS